MVHGYEYTCALSWPWLPSWPPGSQVDSYGGHTKCCRRAAGVSVLTVSCSESSTLSIPASRRTEDLYRHSSLWDGLWDNEDLDSCTLHLPGTGTDAEWNCFSSVWMFLFSHLFFLLTSSANKCVFEWSYSCLAVKMYAADHKGMVWSYKTDRPPRLLWKTAWFLSENAFQGDLGSAAKADL